MRTPRARSAPLRFRSESRRLAGAAIKLGRRALLRIDTLVTPDTLLRWYRRPAVKKYEAVIAHHHAERNHRDSRTLLSSLRVTPWL